MRVVLVAALRAALAPLAFDAGRGLAAAGTVSAGRFPPERLHGHAAEREQIVGKLRALHRDARLAVIAGRQRVPARHGNHPARLAAPRAEQQRLLGRYLEARGGVAERLAVVPGAQEIMRNADTNHDFRQASDFFFLTGFDEPDAVAVFNPTHVKDRYVLFVRPRDREMEIWNGYRAGIEGAVARYGADAAYSIDELDQKLRDYGLDRPVLYYRLGNPAFDPRITRLVGELRAARPRGYTPPTRLEDSSPILNELRLRKLPEELARLRRACEISAEAHTEAMRFTHPGLMEYQVQAVLEYIFRMNGSRRNAYPSIVGSGPNACILHYLENNRRMENVDLLLI